MRTTPLLGDVEFALLSALLKEKCGLFYPPAKRHELEKAWSRVADGMDSKQFCMAIGTPRGKELFQRFLNALTVGETYFFRIQPHFDALRNLILPDIIARKGEEKTIHILSAGCATGEEPYSLAMLVMDYLAGDGEWGIDILAADVNTGFLETAALARYREWSFRKVDEYWRSKYFSRHGDTWEVVPAVTKHVRFAHVNLLDEDDMAAVAGPYAFDLILCRNVTIYFDLASNEKLLGMLTRRLTPEGWYLPGHADPMRYTPALEIVQYPGAVLYRRRKPGLPAEKPVRPAPAAPPYRELAREPAPKPATAEVRAPSRDDVFARVDTYIAMGEDEAAREICEPLAAQGEDGEVFWRLGRVMGNLGQYDDAVAWFERAIQAAPYNALPYYYAALVLEETGDNEGAFQYLRRSLFLDHSFALGHFAMGNFYRWRRDDVRAGRSYRNVLSLLKERADDAAVSSDGLTAGQLRNIVNQIL